jgi:hypothetical protein
MWMERGKLCHSLLEATSWVASILTFPISRRGCMSRRDYIVQPTHNTCKQDLMSRMRLWRNGTRSRCLRKMIADQLKFFKLRPRSSHNFLRLLYVEMYVASTFHCATAFVIMASCALGHVVAWESWAKALIQCLGFRAMARYYVAHDHTRRRVIHGG